MAALRAAADLANMPNKAFPFKNPARLGDRAGRSPRPISYREGLGSESRTRRREKRCPHQGLRSTGMEHLWSPAGATRGNRSQMGRPRKRLKQADRQPVATHGNRFRAHGKEGVDGSSPSEGFQKVSKWPFFLP